MDQLVLKTDDVFVISDSRGDIHENGGGLGLYSHDMRFLSIFDVTVNGLKLDILSSSSEQNFMGNLQFANPLLRMSDGTLVLPHTLSIRRNRFLNKGLHERIGFFNYNPFPISIDLTLTIGSDFKDMFDIRGYDRPERGKIQRPEYNEKSVTLGYEGLDEIQRQTLITFDRSPDRVEIEEPSTRWEGIKTWAILPDENVAVQRTYSRPPTSHVTFHLELEPQNPSYISVSILAVENAVDAEKISFDDGVASTRETFNSWFNRCSNLETDNDVFNRLIQRSIFDIRVLSEERATGFVPVAGIPWFACPFGRDSIITALQTLILNPDIALGTLRFLAKYQGTRYDDWRDEEPGKILHELRSGERANLGESPHTPYYGSVDSTPLFLMLFAETMNWLDDLTLYEELLPAARKALDWIDEYGDLDGDGYVEFKKRSSKGLTNQGWKDSHDSLMHPDGSIPPHPHALVEVQGYVYAAKKGMSALYRRKGHLLEAERLENEAEFLKKRFNRDFWLEDEKYFAQALDADKKAIPSISSNPGHCLYCGIIDQDKAGFVVERLMAEDLACGWGIRTLSSKMPQFNPMSYHNGSVWPHDNSIIVAGMKRYGYHQAANEIIGQIFQAGIRFRYYRLPELYCGFSRDQRYYSLPAEYPVSCSPQAWAAGSAILLYQTMLGLKVNIPDQHLMVNPRLPEWLENATIRNMQIGKGTLDLFVERRPGGVGVRVSNNNAGVKVEID